LLFQSKTILIVWRPIVWRADRLDGRPVDAVFDFKATDSASAGFVASYTGDVNAPGRSGATMLWAAIDRRKPQTLAALVAKGVDPCAQVSWGDIPAGYAAAQGGDMLRLFLRSFPHLTTAQLNCPDSRDGWTPLHYAAFAGCVDSALLLVERGVNVAATDHRGRSAAALALEHGHASMAEVLTPAA
jgi:ankyrin repeat protein